MKIALIHGHLIVDGNKEYLDGSLLIEDDKIVEVYKHSNLDKLELDDYKIIDLKGLIVMPGFFDSHIHGAYGIDFNDFKRSDFKHLSFLLAKSGTTSFLTSLCPNDKTEQIMSMLNDVEDAYARFQGIHLEGPFISKKYAGVCDLNNLKEVDQRIVDNYLLHNHKVKSMTIAYELANAQELGKYLRSKDIRVMLGHSGILKKDIKEGFDGITHLFNAMLPLHHRDLSLVNIAFNSDKYVEVIGDGIHIDPEVLKLIMKNIDRERIMLVSDCSFVRGLKDGVYQFLNQRCLKEGNMMKRADGKLAGSVSSISEEIKIMYELGANYTDLLLYSGLNAYRFYGLDKKLGTLTKGKYADIVMMNDDLDIRYTLLKGKVIHA